MTREEMISAIESMTVLELNELVKALEEKFGVSAAAPVAVAAAPAADAGDMAGKWVVAYGDVEGMIMTGDELASFGLTVVIELKADGTVIVK